MAKRRKKLEGEEVALADVEAAEEKIAEERAARATESKPVPPANREEQVARARAHVERATARREADPLHPAAALVARNRARREGGS